MKKWLTLSLALVAAAVSQAVTVAWTVPNSEYNVNNWATKDANGNLSFNVYFVYSASALTVGQAYDKATTSTVGDGNVEYGYYMGDGTYQELAVYANNLNPHPNAETNRVTGDGYYYMVVINKTNSAEYAVAGTTSQVKIVNNTVTTADGGIYANPVGDTPTPEDYFDMAGWLGGTWTNALVPEPTVLALLALGVAGVALRRKQNFKK